MRSKGHVYVVAESMYSDRPRIPMNPPHHEGSPLRTSAFSQGGHGTVLYVFGRPCTMVYAPGREYAFMEPRERWCVLFPITGRTHEEVVRLMYSDGPLTQGAPYGQDYSTPSDCSVFFMSSGLPFSIAMASLNCAAAAISLAAF